MTPIRFCLFLLTYLISIVSAAASSPPPWCPAPRTDAKAAEWITLHEHFLDEIKHRKPKVLFIGDSITAYWPVAGAASWKKYFVTLGSLDIAIGGEITQSILWRLQHGAVNGINPDVVVLMIGSNNLIVDAPEDTVLGVKTIVMVLEKKLPQAKIILLGVLPRDPGPLKIPLRQRIRQANALLATLNSGKVHFVDLGQYVLEKDDSISRVCLPDGIHPSAAGYEKLSAPVVSAITKSRN